ncbi:MAG: hypothetical protein KJ795_10450 [Gammaproteobacteria bacterium]|nr:hypothetical protein [Gammaproteobacteria bacterium]MBU1968192.1 hypothetical protein [Gammaproteobacteria bacterium]
MTALLALLFVVFVAFAKSGGDMAKAIFVSAFMAVFIGITWYFSSRRSQPPTEIERFAATAWLVIRRIVGIVGALVFLVVGLLFAIGYFDGAARLDTLTRLGYAVFLLGVSAFCVWVAIYGQGWNRLDWKDDVALHRENKKRYHWRR